MERDDEARNSPSQRKRPLSTSQGLLLRRPSHEKNIVISVITLTMTYKPIPLASSTHGDHSSDVHSILTDRGERRIRRVASPSPSIATEEARLIARGTARSTEGTPHDRHYGTPCHRNEPSATLRSKRYTPGSGPRLDKPYSLVETLLIEDPFRNSVGRGTGIVRTRHQATWRRRAIKTRGGGSIVTVREEWAGERVKRDETPRNGGK